jgi:hypothetical protein
MATVEERWLKVLLKGAVVEVMEARRDLFRDAVEESLEEISPVRAIEQGEKNRLTSRKNIFKRLEKTA